MWFATPVLQDPVFGFDVPLSLPGVPDDVVQPRNAWADKDAYDAQRDKLAEMFQKNFEQFSGPGVTDYTSFGPQLQK